MPLIGPRLSAAVAVAALVVLNAAVTRGKKAKPPACGGGRFVLEQPLEGAGAPAVMVIAGRSVTIEGLCPATAAKLTTTRKGTRIRGAWPVCGTLPKVRIAVRFDASCTRLSGVLQARRTRTPVAARRSSCGDGIVDGGGSEECEPPGNAGCDLACRLVAGTTTTSVPAVTTTTVTSSTTTTVPAVTTTTATTSTTTTTLEKLDVWRPTTVPWDPECRSGCVEVARTVPLAHSGAELRFRMNPAVDDPIAQWGDCLESVLSCLERDGGRLAPCIDDAACPAECKAVFRTRAAGAADEDARADAFEAVFVDRAAPCRPADEVAP